MSKDGATTSAAGGKYFCAIIFNMQLKLLIPLTSCCVNHITEDTTTPKEINMSSNLSYTVVCHIELVVT